MNEQFPGGSNAAFDAPVDARLATLEKGDIVLYTPNPADGLLYGEPIAAVVVKIHNRTCCSASVNLRLFLDVNDVVSAADTVSRSGDVLTYRAYGAEGQPGSWRFKSN